MRPRGLLIAAVLLAILAGGVWWSNKQKAAEEASIQAEQKKAEAAAARVARPRGIRAVETLEDVRQIRVGDAGALVGDRHDRLPIDPGHSHRDGRPFG